MDVMGGVVLDDGTELKVVTGIDDHRRFCVAAGLVRRVASNAVTSVDNQPFSVARAFRGELVDVSVDETTIQVWRQNHLIQTVARKRSGPVRKVRADALHVKHQPDTKRQASAGT